MLLSAVIKFFIKGHEHLCPCITLSKIKINTAALLLAQAHSSAHVMHKTATPLTNGGTGWEPDLLSDGLLSDGLFVNRLFTSCF